MQLQIVHAALSTILATAASLQVQALQLFQTVLLIAFEIELVVINSKFFLQLDGLKSKLLLPIVHEFFAVVGGNFGFLQITLTCLTLDCL